MVTFLGSKRKRKSDTASHSTTVRFFSFSREIIKLKDETERWEKRPRNAKIVGALWGRRTDVVWRRPPLLFFLNNETVMSRMTSDVIAGSLRPRFWFLLVCISSCDGWAPIHGRAGWSTFNFFPILTRNMDFKVMSIKKKLIIFVFFCDMIENESESIAILIECSSIYTWFSSFSWGDQWKSLAIHHGRKRGRN